MSSSSQLLRDVDSLSDEEARAELELILARRLAAASAREELDAIVLVLRKRRWKADPVVWARERLGVFLWSMQARILQSVKDFHKTAAMTCHEIGKSFSAAVAVGYWIDIHLPGEAVAVTTAPTGRQVRAVLWKEIGRVHAKGLAGRTNQTEWLMYVPEAGKEELVAFGFKPADFDPTAFQGIHAPKILVVPDEACGIPTLLYDAFESLGANEGSRILAIGNPDFTNSEFFRICKPGSDWNVIQVGAFDTPNFTGEDVPEFLRTSLIGKTYVEDCRKKWAPSWKWNAEQTRVLCPSGADPKDTHPFWQSKVLGLFPKTDQEGGLIPYDWILAAQARELKPEGPSELGGDVGGGGDRSTTCHRLGPVARIISADANPSTMQTCGKIVAELKATNSSCAKIDVIGIGRGIVDRGIELEEPFIGINVGEGPICNCKPARAKPGKSHEDECNVECFLNLRAQNWWEMRGRFEKEDIDLDPDDIELAEELAAITFTRTSKGKIQIVEKKQIKKTLGRSPDKAEALMLAFATPPPTKAEKPAARLLF